VSEEVSIERITARGMAEVHGDLVELLRRGVMKGGVTVGFLPPLSTREAAYGHEVREALEGGNRRLLVARPEGRVVGTGPRSPRCWYARMRVVGAWIRG
jgi:hypothetical protein